VATANELRLWGLRRGYDWSGHYPAIGVTAMLLRARSFSLDGEAVVCGPDGVAIFDALHRRGTVTEAMLYAFDLLELNGDDFRGMPLVDRKKRLARLLGGRRLGIVLSDHTDEDGTTIFRQACLMGLEGIEAVERALSLGAVPGLAQDQKPGKPGDDPGAGGGMVDRASRCLLSQLRTSSQSGQGQKWAIGLNRSRGSALRLAARPTS
jgi:ATP dependent DNA ligase domain